MDPRQAVQIAILCLKGLDQAIHQRTTLKDLSRKQGLPIQTCESTMTRLTQAGIVEQLEDGSFRLSRSLEELTALEILQAVWSSVKTPPAFRLLVGRHQEGALQKTLELIRSAPSHVSGSWMNG